MNVFTVTFHSDYSTNVSSKALNNHNFPCKWQYLKDKKSKARKMHINYIHFHDFSRPGKDYSLTLPIFPWPLESCSIHRSRSSCWLLCLPIYNTNDASTARLRADTHGLETFDASVCVLQGGELYLHLNCYVKHTLPVWSLIDMPRFRYINISVEILFFPPAVFQIKQ